LETTLLDAILAQPGISRRGLHQATGGKTKAEAMDAALAWLEARKLAHAVPMDTGGRPAECWFPGEGCELSNKVLEPEKADATNAAEKLRENEQSPPSDQTGDSSFARQDSAREMSVPTIKAPDSGNGIGLTTDEIADLLRDDFLDGLDN